MSEYTPETLKMAGGEFDCPDCGAKSVPQEALDAHADAWEADRQHSDEYARLWHRDAAQLASLRAERDKLADAVGVLKTENVRLLAELAQGKP